ncbi:RNA 2',3'-cyclic phosphodiesterase [Pseudomonas cavernae]|uniref:RNA 2',3'-cyclic phosphodiesterase n=1 Tax=Pseudomonas cavernae TaxID=2320867 RepID=A0A385Z2F1_9PSED|nr:RNA 2',3'-cyclic phosphodiesterase [Pseudomonas cavernae]
MTTPPLRLFFALPCPPEQAQAMVDWRDSLSTHSRPVTANNLHLTLIFLGAQPRGRLPELKALAASIDGHSFRLQLDRLERWNNGLLHLALSQPPEALLQLVHELRERLQLVGFNLESRAFHPHLTLARHCSRLPAGPAPAFAWQVEHFALFVSESNAKGTRYRVLSQWPLLPPSRNNDAAVGHKPGGNTARDSQGDGESNSQRMTD